MSKHSKWAKIKRQKTLTDAKRGDIFTRLAKQITIAAASGADPAANFKLRLAIETAKKQNLPKIKIQAAIDRASTASGTDNLSEILYEARGKEGLLMIIKCLTSNRNRTVSELKSILNKHDGQLANTQWQFQAKSQITVNCQKTIDENLELRLIDHGSEDFSHLSNRLTITGSKDSFEKIIKLLQQAGLEIIEAKIIYQANNKLDTIEASDQKLLEAIEEQTDVVEVYHN